MGHASSCLQWGSSGFGELGHVRVRMFCCSCQIKKCWLAVMTDTCMERA